MSKYQWKLGSTTARCLLRSMVWNRHKRQKVWPQGVVMGAYSNFMQSVQSKSLVRSGFSWLLLEIKPSDVLSKFCREAWRGLLHIIRYKQQQPPTESKLVLRLKLRHNLTIQQKPYNYLKGSTWRPERITSRALSYFSSCRSKTRSISLQQI